MEALRKWLEAVSVYLSSAVVPAAILLAVGTAGIRLMVQLLRRGLGRTRLEPAAHRLILTVAKAALYGLLGLILASRLGIDVTGIVALASVLTLAVSLAVQNMLTNVISGFTLLYTKPFHAGDYVEVAGQGGFVRSIGLTYTELATPDNKNICLPNSAVTGAEIINYTVLGTRRVEVCVHVSYESPIDTVLEALKEAARLELCLPDKEPFAAVKSFSDSSIEYTVHAWVAAEDYWTALYSIQKRVKEVFEAKELPPPYPHLHVHQTQSL